MDLKQAHDFFRLIMNKEQGGWHSPEEIDTFLHHGQMGRFTELVDVFAKTQKIHDSLNVFIVRKVFTTTSNGLIELPLYPLPDPYEHFLSGHISYYDNVAARTRYKTFKMLNSDEISIRLESQILEVTASDPIAEMPARGQIQLYPAAAYSGNLRYLRTPKKPLFKYTESGRELTYQASASVQLEWNESNMTKILLKALQFAGVNMSDDTLVQYTEAKNAQEI